MFLKKRKTALLTQGRWWGSHSGGKHIHGVISFMGSCSLRSGSSQGLRFFITRLTVENPPPEEMDSKENRSQVKTHLSPSPEAMAAYQTSSAKNHKKVAHEHWGSRRVHSPPDFFRQSFCLSKWTRSLCNLISLCGNNFRYKIKLSPRWGRIRPWYLRCPLPFCAPSVCCCIGNDFPPIYHELPRQIHMFLSIQLESLAVVLMTDYFRQDVLESLFHTSFCSSPFCSSQ